jgi:HK97 family phage major capsid protein
MAADIKGDLDLLARVVYEEYYRLSPAERERCRWVMDAEMLRFVRELRDSWSVPLMFPTLSGSSMILLGHPVEVRDGIKGVHLEVDA